MNYLEIKGARLPVIGFGTWSLRGWRGRRAIARALALGYRHLDTAQIYDNEEDVGHALRASGVARDEVFLATKLRRENLRGDTVRRSAEASLRRLGTDYIDLLLIHWPSEDVPLAETLAVMAELRAAGKARFIGVCNFNARLLAEAVETHGADLLCNQVEYHPFVSQRTVREAAHRLGLALVAYSPVARGRVDRDPTIRAIASRYGKTPAQIALRWLIEQAGVVAIPKAADRTHAAENLDIFDFTLAAEDRAAIGKLPTADGRIQGREPGMPDWDPP